MTTERTIHIETVAKILVRLRDHVAHELECIDAPVCRADVIVSDRPVQVGGDSRGPDGRQGRAWIRQVTEDATGGLNPGACPDMQVQAEIAVVRCHTPIEDDDALTSQPTLTSEMLRVHEDKRAVLAAIGREPVTPVRWTPYGPRGNVIGGIWTVAWTVRYAGGHTGR